jgi:phage/plasmid-associated DNA primase
VAVSETVVYAFDSNTGIWMPGTLNEAAVLVRRAAAAGVLKESLTPADAAYLKSCEGPVKVLKSMITDFKDPTFAERLNQLPEGCVAFDNGLLDGATGSIRPFCKADLVSITIGYEYHEKPDPEAAAFVQRHYEQVFPLADEREYFKRIVAKAMFSKSQSKHFIVTGDIRDGNNGKTTHMRFTESTFGKLTAIAERDFLYESGHVNPNGAAANLLAFIDKRLTFFDEPDAGKRLDIRRLKDLTSGDSRIRGRGLQSGVMQEACWRALIVIACNEGNFPRIDATDRPLMRRMKAIQMRGLFVGPEELAQRLDAGEEHVFPLIEEGVKEMLNGPGRVPHVHLLMAAYQRTRIEGGFGPEPASVAEMLDRVVGTADPRVDKVFEFLDAKVDFAPARGPEHKGHKYYAWIVEQELIDAYWTWYVEMGHRRELREDLERSHDTKTAWKAVLKKAMQMRGRELNNMKPGQQATPRLSYDKVRFV